MAEPNISTYPNLRINFWGICKSANTYMKFQLWAAENKRPFEPILFDIEIHNKVKKVLTPQGAMKNGFLNISLTRHPFERFVSMWRDMVRTRPHKVKSYLGGNASWTPLEMIQKISTKDDDEINEHLRTQGGILGDYKMDRIFKIENIHDTWDLDIPLDRERRHVSDPARVEATQELVEVVENRYYNDYDRFGYERKYIP